jgi:NADPH:quinone reductase-like Zn-dependent oxidoreductase
MKAIVYSEYGPLDGLRLEEVPKPVPGEDEVLVEVHASSVNYGNLAVIKGEPFVARFWSGLLKPKFRIPGGDLAGRVEAVGGSVTRFKPGDEVFGDISGCGFGAWAEYAVAPVNTLALKPAAIGFEEAAAVPQAALVALQGLRDKGGLQTGQKVLIVGASGGNGTFAVQIAGAFGAEVTGVCGTRNVELVRSLGAGRVFDYTKEDFAAGEERYDLILAMAGYRSIYDYKRALGLRGTYVMVGGAQKQIFQAMLLGPLLSRKGGQKLTNLYEQHSQKDLDFMKELIEAGKVAPVIDRRYALAETVEALRYYSQGHARGKVVITVRGENKT